MIKTMEEMQLAVEGRSVLLLNSHFYDWFDDCDGSSNRKIKEAGLLDGVEDLQYHVSLLYELSSCILLHIVSTIIIAAAICNITSLTLEHSTFHAFAKLYSMIHHSNLILFWRS